MKSLLVTLALAMVFAPSYAGAAQTSSTSGGKKDKTATASATASEKTMKASGTVVSATDTSLVVSGKNKKETTYTLNADTKKMGTLTAGTPVTVEYKVDGKDRIATMVTAHERKTASTSSSSSKKSKGNKPSGT